MINSLISNNNLLCRELQNLSQYVLKGVEKLEK